MLDTLGVNISSIVIGALLTIIIISWVDALKALTEYVFFYADEASFGGATARHFVYKKFLSALFISLLGGIITIFVYTMYSQASHSGV